MCLCTSSMQIQAYSSTSICPHLVRSSMTLAWRVCG
jgi:hypothetical protein